MMWGWGPAHMGFGAGWIGMGFIMLLFWIAVVVGIVYLIRHLARRPAAGQPHDGPTYMDQAQEQPRPSSAMRILEERYARGEVDQEEFLRRKADLTR